MALSKLNLTFTWTGLVIRKNWFQTRQRLSSAAAKFLLSPLDDGELSEYKRDAEIAIGKRSYPIFDGTRYNNPWPSWKDPKFIEGLKYAWRDKRFRKALKAAIISRFSSTAVSFDESVKKKAFFDENLPIIKPKFLSSYDPKSPDLELTWVGNSTCLLMLDGVMILTDPVFSDYCSPLHTGNFRRFRPVPFTVDQLPDGVLIVVISHNHFDHLDAESLQALHNKFGNRVTFFVPTGVAKWCYTHVNGLRKDAVVEMTWWQSARYQLTREDGAAAVDNSNNNGSFQIINLPAQHWSARTLLNRNKSLWSGWAVIGPSGRRFFFAGDTGYTDTAFKEIGNEVGPFDLSAIPIGAYEPRDFMVAQHCNPLEAVRIHLEVKSKKSVGIHWGTFYLSFEPVLAPRFELADAVEALGLDSQSFFTVAHGETVVIKKQ